jgi:hypothetical protein
MATETPPPIVTATSTSSSKGSKLVALLLIPFVMLIIGLALGFMLGRFVLPLSGCINTTPTPTPTATPSALQNLTDFTGTYVTAKLPTGWSIVESTDFANASVSAGTYTGLARLTVLHGDTDVVYLAAGNGIGDTGECSHIYKFADTSPDSIQAQLNTNGAFIPTVSATIVDLTTSSHTDYTFLGNTVRRVGTTLYFKADTVNNTFNASCGLDAEYRTFTGISFVVDMNGTPETLSHYFVNQSIPSTFTTTELLELDEVLESIKGV